MFRFRYVNTDGQEVNFGMEKPFLVTKKEGLGSVANNITTQTQYGLDGAVMVGQQLAVREIKISGEMIADSMEQFNDLRTTVISAFNPSSAGTLYYIVDDKTYMIDVLIEIAPDFTGNNKGLTQEFTIQFKALDPYWSDLTTYNNLIPLSGVKNAFAFPLTITDKFKFSSIISGVIQNIENNGDVAVGAEFTFKLNAPASNIKVINVQTQDFFGFTGDFTTGTVLYVNTKRNEKQANLTAPDGTVNNAMANRMDGSSFITLAKGNNFLQVLADKGQESISTDMQFNPLVLGV